MLAPELDLIDGSDSWIDFRPSKDFTKVADVLNLAGLGHTIPIYFIPFFCIKSHCFVGAVEETREQEETANESTSTPFAMVAMNHRNSVDGRQEMFEHNLANLEQNMKLRSFMVLPVEGLNVAKDLAVYFSATNVYYLVILAVPFI